MVGVPHQRGLANNSNGLREGDSRCYIRNRKLAPTLTLSSIPPHGSAHFRIIVDTRRSSITSSYEKAQDLLLKQCH